MYKITFDISNGFILSCEEITTDSITINDSNVARRLMDGEYASVIDGNVVFNEKQPTVTENIVPPGEIVGVPLEDFENR